MEFLLFFAKIFVTLPRLLIVLMYLDINRQ
jgi:hypothetical protein